MSAASGTEHPALKGQQFIALTTYRKAGAAVTTPVWFAHLGGRLYIWTGANSGKVKRLRNNPQVELAPSDAGGKPLGEKLAGRGRILPEVDWRAPLQAMQRKYGLQFWFFRTFARLRGGKSTFLEIELDG
jgi:hypothetical protein